MSGERDLSVTERKVIRALHKADVDLLADCAGYADHRKADVQLHGLLAPLWRSVLGLEDSNKISLSEQLGMSPVMILVLHLFCRAVHKRWVGRKRLPVMNSYMPVWDEYEEITRKCPALSTNEIARIIHRSPSAVDRAIARFRTDYEDTLFSKGLLYPLYVETGKMIDVAIDRNLSLAFMRSDYVYAHRVAVNARINDAPTNHKQISWCNEKVLGASMPSSGSMSIDSHGAASDVAH